MEQEIVEEPEVVLAGHETYLFVTVVAEHLDDDRSVLVVVLSGESDGSEPWDFGSGVGSPFSPIVMVGKSRVGRGVGGGYIPGRVGMPKPRIPCPPQNTQPQKNGTTV